MAKAATSRARVPALPINAFIGHPAPPTDRELKAALGSTAELWHALVAVLRIECRIDAEEWHSYSPKAGWSLRLKTNGRTIVYLAPLRGRFLASFALGERAVSEARRSLPQLAATLDAARRYAEGTAVRIEVRRASDVGLVARLAAIKAAN